MLKLFKFMLLLSVLFISSAKAQVEEMTLEPSQRKLIYTGFENYPPYGVIDEEKRVFTSVFNYILKSYKDRYDYSSYYNFTGEYNERVREVRRGDIDVVFGIYHDTEGYEGIDYIYPSIISNPVTIVMLPNRIGEVKSLEDLKKLRGARHSKEKLSDYVLREVKKLNVEEIDNSYDLYGSLFRKDIDYIVIGHYFGLIEAIKLGLRDKVAFAKTPLWNMPMFIGVSKASSKRGFLQGSLRKLSEDPDAPAKLKKYLDEIVAEYAEQNEGTVPPSYSIY